MRPILVHPGGARAPLPEHVVTEVHGLLPGAVHGAETEKDFVALHLGRVRVVRGRRGQPLPGVGQGRVCSGAERGGRWHRGGDGAESGEQDGRRDALPLRKEGGGDYGRYRKGVAFCVCACPDTKVLKHTNRKCRTEDRPSSSWQPTIQTSLQGDWLWRTQSPPSDRSLRLQSCPGALPGLEEERGNRCGSSGHGWINVCNLKAYSGLIFRTASDCVLHTF